MAEFPSTTSDIGFGAAAVATHKKNMADKRKRKLARLQKEAKAAERKALQLKRVLEIEGRKRARAGATMRTYFTSSRNFENRGQLQSSDPLQSTDGGGIEATSSPTQFTETEIGTSQSLDTEVVFSRPAIVPVSDGEDLDVSEDDMVDSNNDLFMDLPPRGGKKKSTDAKEKGAAASGTYAFQKLKKNYDL